jgi:hypothetical protein
MNIKRNINKNLSEELNELSLPEWLCNTRPKCKSRKLFRQILYPFIRNWSWDQINLIQNKNNMLKLGMVLNIFLYMITTRPHWIPYIEHYADDIRRVEHFVQLIPDSFWLASFVPFISGFLTLIFKIEFREIIIIANLIAWLFFLGIL